MERVTIIRSRGDSFLENLAARELQKYLPLVWEAEVKFAEHRAGNQFTITVIVGDRADHTTLTPSNLLDMTSTEGFCLKSHREESRIQIEGGGPLGLLYGVYAFLEKLGCRFYISRDSLPSKKSQPSLPALDEVHEPIFPVRGALPWYDFLCGPSTSNLIDYQRYIDQLLKLRYNCFTLHFYSYEPFLHFTWNGAMQHRAYLDTSATHRWGNRPMRTSDFWVGRDRFRDEVFASEAAKDCATDLDRFLKAEELVRQALTHAKERGMVTNVGIEVMDLPPEILQAVPEANRFEAGILVCPSSPSARSLLEARLRALVNTYPMADIYTLWQTEGSAIRRTKGCPCKACRAYARKHAHLAYQDGDIIFLHWIELAAEMFPTLAPRKRLATGGWSIESTYRGGDRFLPNEVMFTSLLSPEPLLALKTKQPEKYANLHRDRWAMPWGEFDGRMYLPQPRVTAYPELFKKLHRAGATGVVLIHWRQRAIEENLRFAARLMWNLNEKPKQFYLDVASTECGSEVAKQVAKGMMQLEQFEQFLVNKVQWLDMSADYGAPPMRQTMDMFLTNLPFPKLTIRQYRKRLRQIPEIRKRLTKALYHLKEAERLSAPRKDQWLAYWINRVEFYDMFLQCYEFVYRAALAYQEALKHSLIDDVRYHLGFGEAVRLMRLAPMRKMIQHYEKIVPDKGDLGVLAVLNTKLLQSYILSLQSLEQQITYIAATEAIPEFPRPKGSSNRQTERRK